MSAFLVRAYLGVGANLGDRDQAIRAACRALGALPRTRRAATASVYATSPVGFVEQPDFLNTVVAVDTGLAARELFDAVRGIERALGRVERPRWREREIDIDVLTYGTERLAWDDVAVPHPRMHERRFVLVPFAEIAPATVPAGFSNTVAELLAACPDSGRVERVGTIPERPR